MIKKCIEKEVEEKAEDDFYKNLGILFKDPDLPKRLRNRTYDVFEAEFKEMVANGGDPFDEEYKQYFFEESVNFKEKDD